MLFYLVVVLNGGERIWIEEKSNNWNIEKNAIECSNMDMMILCIRVIVDWKRHVFHLNAARKAINTWPVLQYGTVPNIEYRGRRAKNCIFRVRVGFFRWMELDRNLKFPADWSCTLPNASSACVGGWFHLGAKVDLRKNR